MPEPYFIISGVESVNKMPDLIGNRNVALLFNVPALLRGNAALRHANALIDEYHGLPVILDSGGKQIAEIAKGRSKLYRDHIPGGNKPIRVGQTLHLAPEHLAQAVQKLPRVNVLMSLDDPVLPTNDPREQEESFRRKLERNVEWARQTIEMRDIMFPDVQVLMPVQCYQVEQFDVLWDEVMDLGIDGLSLPGRCFKKGGDLISFLKKFSDIGIRRSHFLGSSRLEIVALLCFLGRHGIFEHLAFDSTTWMQAAIRGRLILPYSLRAVRVSGPEFGGVARDLIGQDRVYHRYGVQTLHKMSADQQRQCLRTLNVWAITKTKREIYDHASSPGAIEQLLLRKMVPAITAHKIGHLMAEAQAIIRR